MEEGGRSIVWQAVSEVLRKYSDKGLVGTQEREKVRVKRTKDWIPGMGDEIVSERYRYTPESYSFREALMDGLPDGSPERFYRLHGWLLDDIAADVATRIEAMLDAIEKPTEDKARPDWLKLLTGGKDDTGSAEARAVDEAGPAPQSGGPGQEPRQATGRDRDGAVGNGAGRQGRLRVVSEQPGQPAGQDVEADTGGDSSQDVHVKAGQEAGRDVPR